MLFTKTLNRKGNKKMTYNKTDIRKAFKDIGYKISFKTYTDFIACIIKHEDGQEMPSIFTSETLNKFKPAIDLKNTLKGQCFECDYRIVL
jgi:hypothetical protein